MTIALGCHKWSFQQASTLQAAQIIRALGFERMDLGNAPDLNPSEAALHVADTVAHLKAIQAQTGVRFIDVFPQLPQPPNHPDAEARRLSRRLLGAWFEIAARVGLQGVTLTPGHYFAGHSAQDDFERAVEEMRWAVAVGQRCGVQARIEPHVSSVAWTPFLALEMAKQAPGLSLTIDHSHFVFHDIPYEHIALMHPYGSHWHARQARPGDICCATDVGKIDFQRIVHDLRAQGYEGTLCLEFTPGMWMAHGTVDCVSETLALTKLLRQYLAE
jgi:sugar phosphate isomerase/epimerase